MYDEKITKDEGVYHNKRILVAIKHINSDCSNCELSYMRDNETHCGKSKVNNIIKEKRCCPIEDIIFKDIKTL